MLLAVCPPFHFPFFFLGRSSGLTTAFHFVSFFTFSRSALTPFSFIISHVALLRSGRSLFLFCFLCCSASLHLFKGKTKNHAQYSKRRLLLQPSTLIFLVCSALLRLFIGKVAVSRTQPPHSVILRALGLWWLFHCAVG